MSIPGIVHNPNVHWAHPDTRATLGALGAIPLDLEERKATSGLEKHCDGADVLAKSAIILEDKGQAYANQVVKGITGYHPVQPGHTVKGDVILIVESKPFIIETSTAGIQVLGTSFNVNTKIPEKELEVIVKTGKVKVYKKDDISNNILLEKGEVGVIKSNVLGKYFNEDENYLSWKTKKMIFRDHKLNEVIDIINKTYNTHINYENDAIGELPYTVTFDQESIEEVLNIICHTFDLKFEKTRNGYKLYMTSI